MRLSRFPLATTKETPADAEIISHRLMLRAGLIRKLGAGLYTWMPLGLRVLRKVEQIVRDEMNRAGALELLMPSVQPAELWQESGRWDVMGAEMLRIKDRHKNDYCYGPTHEEVICFHFRQDYRSYRQLPVNYYQIQTKFRDERRPRFGVMRAREFLMKDAYSFHMDAEGLAAEYQNMRAAYTRIFSRIGADFRAVKADSGTALLAAALGGVILAFATADPKVQVFSDQGLWFLLGSLVAAVGNTVLDVLEADRLDEQAAQLGSYLRKGLQEISQRHPVVGDVRGRGLLVGLERGFNLRGQKEGTRVAGVRTFSLMGLGAGIAGLVAGYQPFAAAASIPSSGGPAASGGFR